MFDDRLKNLRKAKGLTSSRVAADLDLPPTTYSNYELDKREPSAMTLIKIARYFDVSIDYLCGYTSDKQSIDTKTLISKSKMSINKQRILDLFDLIDEIQQENVIARAEMYAEQNQEAKNKGVG